MRERNPAPRGPYHPGRSRNGGNHADRANSCACGCLRADPCDGRFRGGAHHLHHLHRGRHSRRQAGLRPRGQRPRSRPLHLQGQWPRARARRGVPARRGRDLVGVPGEGHLHLRREGGREVHPGEGSCRVELYVGAGREERLRRRVVRAAERNTRCERRLDRRGRHAPGRETSPAARGHVDPAAGRRSRGHARRDVAEGAASDPDRPGPAAGLPLGHRRRSAPPLRVDRSGRHRGDRGGLGRHPRDARGATEEGGGGGAV